MAPGSRNSPASHIWCWLAVSFVCLTEIICLCLVAPLLWCYTRPVCTFAAVCIVGCDCARSCSENNSAKVSIPCSNCKTGGFWTCEKSLSDALASLVDKGTPAKVARTSVFKARKSPVQNSNFFTNIHREDYSHKQHKRCVDPYPIGFVDYGLISLTGAPLSTHNTQACEQKSHNNCRMHTSFVFRIQKQRNAPAWFTLSNNSSTHHSFRTRSHLNPPWYPSALQL